LSKIKKNKINFDDNDFLVNVDIEKDSVINEIEPETPEQEVPCDTVDEQEQIVSDAEKEAFGIIEKAKEEAKALVENTKKEINKEALDEKEKILNDAKKEAVDLLNNSKEELENLRIQTTKSAYDDGYKDGMAKIQEELEEKIKDFDNFLGIQNEAKEKILKSASKDILDIIGEISKKILLREVNSETLDKIIQKTIAMLEKKENINIILSTKYASLLLELQNKALNNGKEELKLQDFKQYQNFNVIYNDKFAPDTIIIETPKERFDASISSQLDIILRNILENND